MSDDKPAPFRPERHATSGPVGNTDDDLLSAWVNSADQQAFAALVRRHNPRLRAVAFRMVRDDADADDVVQAAWAQVARAAHTFHGRSALATWLYSVTVNAARDHLRRRAVRPGTVSWDEEFEPLTEIAEPVDAGVVGRVEVAALLAELPTHQREAFVLVYLDDVPVADAAALLGVAEGTVKSRCSRAKSRLAARLAQRYRTSDG